MPAFDIRKIHVLRGPNLWTNHPVLEAWVDPGNLKQTTSTEFPEFCSRLTAWLPGLTNHCCGEGAPGGFAAHLDGGTSPAHLLERVTIELLALVGHPATFSITRPPAADGLYRVVVGFLDESVAEACLRSARTLLLAAYRAGPLDLAAELEDLRDVVDCHALGPSTKAMVDAAKQRGIPWRRLQPGRSLIQFGHGFKQRRIWTAETDRTGAIAEHLSNHFQA